MSEDIMQRIQSVIQRALVGLANWSALKAYSWRLEAVQRMLNSVDAPAPALGFFESGTIGNGLVVPVAWTRYSVPGSTLSYDVTSKAAVLGAAAVGEVSIYDWSIFMKGRPVCDASGCRVVNPDGTVLTRLEKTYFPYSETEPPPAPPIYILYKAVDSDIPVFLGVDGEDEIRMRCIGYVNPANPVVGCEKVPVPLADVNIEIDACLVGVFLDQGDNTWKTVKVVQGLGAYAVEPWAPSSCTQ